MARRSKRRRGAWAAALLCAAVGALAGCASAPAPTPAEETPPAAATFSPPPPRWRIEASTPPPTPTVRPLKTSIGRSAQGRLIEALVFEGTGDAILILGGIHGDEPASTDLVERLAEHLQGHPGDLSGRRVVIVPRTNPDGLAADTRHNARSVDVNRNFPTANYRRGGRHGCVSLSEPESRAVARAIRRYAPTCIVSVHAPLCCVDADGSAASHALARRMAEVSPLPLGDLKELPGSLGSYGAELGAAMITYELDLRRLPLTNPDAYLDAHLPALLLAIGEG